MLSRRSLLMVGGIAALSLVGGQGISGRPRPAAAQEAGAQEAGTMEPGVSPSKRQPDTAGHGTPGMSASTPTGTLKLPETIQLNDGNVMPTQGLGTYALDYATCISSIHALVKSGGRLIDTAYMYHNEDAVGEAVRTCGVPREEVFVTTKLYPNQYTDPEGAIQQALDKLDVGYIDLMLLHHPGSGDVEAYQAMERAVTSGRIRSVGLSNWYVEELEDFLPRVDTVPALVQNEIHPYYQEQDVVPYIQDLGIVVEGWYPLGGRGHNEELLRDSTLRAIADAHAVTIPQVILGWNLQRGIVVIPGSSNPDHIAEDLDIRGFELSEEEMAAIAALDRHEKHDWY